MGENDQKILIFQFFIFFNFASESEFEFWRQCWNFFKMSFFEKFLTTVYFTYFVSAFIVDFCRKNSNIFSMLALLAIFLKCDLLRNFQPLWVDYKTRFSRLSRLFFVKLINLDFPHCCVYSAQNTNDFGVWFFFSPFFWKFFGFINCLT